MDPLFVLGYSANRHAIAEKTRLSIHRVLFDLSGNEMQLKRIADSGIALFGLCCSEAMRSRDQKIRELNSDADWFTGNKPRTSSF